MKNVGGNHIFLMLNLGLGLGTISCTGALINRVDSSGTSTAIRELKNDSVGSQARFTWKTVDISSVRIAIGSVRNEVAAWNGENNSTFTDGKIITRASECTSDYRDATSSTGLLAAEGKCGVDLSPLPPWAKRFARVSVVTKAGTIQLSDTVGVGHAPDGMVFVAAEDWPSASPANIRRDFAIDKFPSSLKAGTTLAAATVYPDITQNGVLLSSDNQSPALGYNQFAAKQGCANRSTETGPKAWVFNDGISVLAGYHLPTEEEYLAATQDCVEDSSKCASSKYGLAALGESFEWTDSLATVDIASQTVIRKSFFDIDGYNSHHSVFSTMDFFNAASSDIPQRMAWVVSGLECQRKNRSSQRHPPLSQQYLRSSVARPPAGRHHGLADRCKSRYANTLRNQSTSRHERAGCSTRTIDRLLSAQQKLS